MANRILTLDSLYHFFVQQGQTVAFSSKESGTPIVVTTDGFFETSEDYMPGMLKLKLRTCHIDTNRNGSHISRENMEKAMPTLKYRPILAHIHKLEDGTEDFYAHNVEIIEGENGETEINYIERQVGCYTADEPWLEYDKEMDKTYVMAYGVIPEEYTSAAKIIRRKNGTKVSCELVINELSYNAKEKYLDLTDFYFGGTTLLGCDEEGNEIGEGMLGSRADITDFCHKEPTFTYQDKLIEVLEKLNITLESFNNTSESNTSEKGGEKVMNKFEELLQQYNVTAEEVTFEYENLSDEELEVAFKDAFDKEETSDNGVVVDEVVVDNSEENIDEDNVPAVVEEAAVVEEVVVVEEDFELKYELSHDDIRSALYTLLDVFSEKGFCSAWIIEVYDNKFIYQDYAENKFYRQGYSKDGDTVELNDSKVEVFNEWLSKEEKDALDTLKSDYAALEAKYNELETFKANIEAAELKAKKDEIFAKAEYECLSDNAEFTALIADAEKFSVDEITAKAKAIFADHVISTGTFSVNSEEQYRPTKTVGLNFNAKPSKKKSAYGGLFEKDE